MSNVVAYGPGIDPYKVREGQICVFQVDTSKAPIAVIDVAVKTDRGTIGKPELKHLRDRIYEVKYMPSQAGNTMQIDVNYGGRPIQNSPFKIKVNPAY